MDCCVCSPMASIYRPPRNTICPSCFEGARTMISFFKELDGTSSQDTNTPMGISDAFKLIKEMKDKEERLNERLSFVDGLVATLREGIHTDILVQPGNGPPIQAHRALLAARSEIFRTMLASDGGLKTAAEESISLPELTHEELHSLLEFLYCGSLREDAAERHACALLVAGDKYDIPYLRRWCERRILGALGPGNALRVMEVAEASSSIGLKERALSTVVENGEEVVLSAEYEAFALRNAHLGVEITRALLVKMKGGKDEGVPRSSTCPCVAKR